MFSQGKTTKTQRAQRQISYTNQAMLVEDLQSFHNQFKAIRSDAEDLFRDLTEAQFCWQPTPRRWSIALCIDHLVVTGHDSMSNMRHSIAEAHRKSIFSSGPFRYGLIERWLVRLMEPPPRIKIRAPKPYAPRVDLSYTDTVKSFLLLQDEFLELIGQAEGIDLSTVKIANPVTRLLRLSLGQEIAFNAAHERRHLWQARKVKEEMRFPHTTTTL